MSQSEPPATTPEESPVPIVVNVAAPNVVLQAPDVITGHPIIHLHSPPWGMDAEFLSRGIANNNHDAGMLDHLAIAYRRGRLKDSERDALLMQYAVHSRFTDAQAEKAYREAVERLEQEESGS